MKLYKYKQVAFKEDIPEKTSDLQNDSGFIDNSYHDSTKQDTLISGTNIKTINGNSIVGNGDLTIGTTRQLINLTEPSTLAMSESAYYNISYECGRLITTNISFLNPSGINYAPEYKGYILSTGSSGESVTLSFSNHLKIITNDDSATITSSSITFDGIKEYEFSIQNNIAYFLKINE